MDVCLAFQLVYGSMGWQTYSVVHPDAVQEMCGRKIHLVEELPRQLDGKTYHQPKSLADYLNFHAL